MPACRGHLASGSPPEDTGPLSWPVLLTSLLRALPGTITAFASHQAEVEVSQPPQPRDQQRGAQPQPDRMIEAHEHGEADVGDSEQEDEAAHDVGSGHPADHRSIQRSLQDGPRPIMEWALLVYALWRAAPAEGKIFFS